MFRCSPEQKVAMAAKLQGERGMRAFVATCLLMFPAIAQIPKPSFKFLLVEGQGAINIVNEKTERNLIVRVEEKYGAPGRGIRVTFTAPSEGPSGHFKNRERSVVVMTDNDGYAVARGFRPNNICGRYDIRVSATVPGGVINALIPQTNAAGNDLREKLFWPFRAAASGGAAIVRRACR
jgi:hypothetical protein